MLVQNGLESENESGEEDPRQDACPSLKADGRRRPAEGHRPCRRKKVQGCNDCAGLEVWNNMIELCMELPGGDRERSDSSTPERPLQQHEARGTPEDGC